VTISERNEITYGQLSFRHSSSL